MCTLRSRHPPPACAIDYSEWWSGGPGKPRGGLYDKLDTHRGSRLCYKCFADHLPYAPADDPGDTARGGLYETRVGGLPWWVTDVCNAAAPKGPAFCFLNYLGCPRAPAP